MSSRQVEKKTIFFQRILLGQGPFSKTGPSNRLLAGAITEIAMATGLTA